MRDKDQETAPDDASDDSAVRADEPKICANCGKQIDTMEWHPVVTRTDDDDGRFRVYAFCDEDCRDKWRFESF